MRKVMQYLKVIFCRRDVHIRTIEQDSFSINAKKINLITCYIISNKTKSFNFCGIGRSLECWRGLSFSSSLITVLHRSCNLTGLFEYSSTNIRKSNNVGYFATVVSSSNISVEVKHGQDNLIIFITEMKRSVFEHSLLPSMIFSAIVHKDEMKLGSFGTELPDRSSMSMQDKASVHMDETSEVLKSRRKPLTRSEICNFTLSSTAVSEQLWHCSGKGQSMIFCVIWDNISF